MKLSIIALTFAMLLSASVFAEESTFSPYMKVGAKATISKAEKAIEDDALSNPDEKEFEYNGKLMPMVGIGMRRIEG